MKFNDFLLKVKEKISNREFSLLIDNLKMLNNDQRIALENAIDTLYNTRKNICISGPAGTGKTFLTKTLITLLSHLYDSSKIAMSAPTHQAKKVLSESSGTTAHTVHSLFRILPNLEEDRSEFRQQGDELPKLKDIMFLVIDEASMVDEALFKIIYDKLPIHTRIIALGDPYQLAPVNSDKISLFFTHKDFVQLKLTEIMRQGKDSPIISQANNIRTRDASSLYNSNNGESGIFGYNSEREFLSKYLDVVKTAEDALDNRIISYTNHSANELNKLLRKYIYKTEEPLIIGEYLVLQNPIIEDDKLIFSNGEVVEVLDIQEKIQRFWFNQSNDSLEVKYFFVKVISLDTEQEGFLNIIKDESSNEFEFKMHCEASQLKLKKRKEPYVRLGLEWKEWWKNKGFFSEVKSIFAGTVHKAQGSTLKNCFVYQKDFHKANEDNYYQLLYVAVTRAKENIYFV